MAAFEVLAQHDPLQIGTRRLGHEPDEARDIGFAQQFGYVDRCASAGRQLVMADATSAGDGSCAAPSKQGNRLNDS